jgi:hypothetical protein
LRSAETPKYWLFTSGGRGSASTLGGARETALSSSFPS